MTNRWLRVFLFLLAAAAAAGASYQAWLDEQALSRARAASSATEIAASNAGTLLGDLRAALYAHVAAGQGHAFWTARAGTLLDAVRAAVVELDGAAAAAGAPLTDTLDGLDRLAAAQQRAAEHVRDGNDLLAGDVIFGEARDLLDTTKLQIARAADATRTAATANEAAMRRRQATLVATAIGVPLLFTLLLVPTGRSIVQPPAPVAAGDQQRFQDAPLTAAESALSLDADVSTHLEPFEPRTTELRPADSSNPEPLNFEPPSLTVPDLASAAALCVDLARLTDSTELPGLLARAASVLDASGVIIWVGNRDGSEIFPVACHGYDERVFARIGSIPRDEHNLTANAYREGGTRTSPAAGASHAALAVPLVGPGGTVGVLSAELREAPIVGEPVVAVASIIAAQLATLVGSMPAAEAAEPKQAQA